MIIPLAPRSIDQEQADFHFSNNLLVASTRLDTSKSHYPAIQNGKELPGNLMIAGRI
jgi:hypothetical protein